MANERAVRLQHGREVRKRQEKCGAYREIAPHHHNEKASSSMLRRGLGSATTRLAPLARAHWRPRQQTQDYNAPGMAVGISNEVLVSDHAPTRARPSPKPTACASLPHTFPLALSPEIPRELPLIRLITQSHASTPRTLHYMSYHPTIPKSSSSARAPSRSRLKAEHTL